MKVRRDGQSAKQESSSIWKKKGIKVPPKNSHGWLPREYPRREEDGMLDAGDEDSSQVQFRRTLIKLTE